MLRNIQVSDAIAINRLNAEQLGYSTSIAFTTKQIQKLSLDIQHHFFLVYEQQEPKRICGYVHGEVYESLYGEPLFNILALAVSDKFQGQGIGKKLMEGIEKEAQKRNFSGIRLNSGEERTQAHLFYEKIGYRSNKKQKRFLKQIK